MSPEQYLKSFFVFAGQAVWASCQAGIVLFISGRPNGVSMIGAFTFSLAVFSPLCLLGSLNARNLIAIGRADVNAMHRDILRRAAVVLVAMVAAAGILFANEKFQEFALASMILLSLRAADQLSDVTAGYYQKANDLRRLMYSFAGRGVISVVTLISVYEISNSLLVSASAAATATIAFVVCFDVVTPLRLSKRQLLGESSKQRPGTLVRSFPFLDSLHANTLRMIVGMTLPAEIVGIFGVVQTTFAPVQLLVSALATSNLKKLADLSKVGDKVFRSFVMKLSGLSFAIVVAFGMFWLLVDVELLEPLFPALDASLVKEVGVRFTCGMLLFGPIGFSAQALLIKRKDFAYGLSPLIGIICFIAFYFFPVRVIVDVSFGMLCAGFLASNALRLVTCGVVLHKGMK